MPQDTYSRPDPLGSILLSARLDKNLSRKEVAGQADINPSSLVKYEQFGIDKEEGQCPPADKLARLCSVLDIDPQTALLASLCNDDYGRFENWGPMSHPRVKWLEDQLGKALKDCNILRSGLDLILDHINLEKENPSEEKKWLFSELLNTKERHESYEQRMLQMGTFYFDVWKDIDLPSGYSAEQKISWVYDINATGSVDNLTEASQSIKHMVFQRSLGNAIERIAKSIPPSEILPIIERLVFRLKNSNDQEWEEGMLREWRASEFNIGTFKDLETGEIIEFDMMTTFKLLNPENEESPEGIQPNPGSQKDTNND